MEFSEVRGALPESALSVVPQLPWGDPPFGVHPPRVLDQLVPSEAVRELGLEAHPPSPVGGFRITPLLRSVPESTRRVLTTSPSASWLTTETSRSG